MEELKLDRAGKAFIDIALEFLDLLDRAALPKAVKKQLLGVKQIEPQEFRKLIEEVAFERRDNKWRDKFHFDRLTGPLTEIRWTCQLPYSATYDGGTIPTIIFLELIGEKWRLRLTGAKEEYLRAKVTRAQHLAEMSQV